MKVILKYVQNHVPSVKFVVSHDDSYDVENFKCKVDEAITNMKEIQPVELGKVSEVESITTSESNIDPFETMYGEMDEESFHRMMEGNDWTYSPLFSDKEFLNEDWHKYTCTETYAAIGTWFWTYLLGQIFRVSKKLMTQVVH